MNAAPLRADETTALDALHGLEVLDSRAEAEFDALVEAASAACGTPISLVSLIDRERQWFKANVGLPGVLETPRDMAFCAHAVLGDTLLEVPDAREDARFADNPLVAGEPHIRFYAGMPLQLSSGERVGTLCVIDREPRRLDDAQRTVLRCLGVVAVKALESRRAMRELVAATAAGARAALVEQHSADAIIGLDAQGRVTRWNPAAEALFDRAAAEMVGGGLDAVIPPGRLGEDKDVLLRIADGRAHTYDTVRLHRSGRVVEVSITAVPEFDAQRRVSGTTKFVRDISDRVRAAKAQAASEALARRMYESTPAMLHSVDRHGCLIAVSDLWLDKLGYGRSEVIGRSAPELLTPESCERSLSLVLPKLFAEGRIDKVDYQIVTRSGQVLDVLVSAVVDYAGDGQPANSLSVMEDVTERRRAERELHTVEQRLRSSEALLDRAGRIAGVGGWEFDLRQQTVLWSAQTRRIHDVEPDFVPDLAGAIAFYAPEARTAVERAVRTSAEHGTPWDLELPLVTAKGRDIWVRAVGTAELEHGRVVRLTGTFQDITERKHTENALRHTLTLLRSVLEASTQVSIIAVAPDGVVSLFNRGAEQLLGYTAAEVVGRVKSLKFHDESEMRQRAFDLTRRLGRKVHTGMVLIDSDVLNEPHEWSYQRKDGSAVPVSLAVTAMRDDDGQLVGYLGVAHDISARLAHEQSQRHAVEKAEAASRAKSFFLANMSHEIRTPMNAVIGLSYLLERTPLNAEQAETLAKIKLASKSLMSIINDVLDLSKIEASEMQLERAPFLLGSVLSELTALSKIQADIRGVGFAVQVPTNLPLAIEGDATRLHQVLTNLLSNAIKFTEQGEVLLSVQPLDAAPGQVRLRFVVEDSGIGIAAEALERLFTPFVQADTSTTRRFGGTGLGLSIVKQLVTLMGGQIGVNSTPQVGSEFWVVLDFAVCDAAGAATLVEVAAPASCTRLRGVRVLVTDDSPINLEVARRILELEGAVVRLANNGQEAVDLLLADPEDFDVVLMDVQMPVLDGHDATRRIRSGLGLTRLPVIALTAGITTGEHERAAAAGMNDVVAKPFDPQALVHCIGKYVQVDARACAPPPVSPRVQPDWPQIEGIDARDARMRLGDDVVLFGTLLRQLLCDFADLDDGPPDPKPDRLTARLHNLKGSAGTLGAKSLERLAAQAEQACRVGALDDASRQLRRIAAELHALQQAAGQMLTARVATEDEEAATVGPLDAEALDEWVQQLKRCDLCAMEGFRVLAPQLRPKLGHDAFTALSQHIDNLRFAEALSTLDAHSF